MLAGCATNPNQISAAYVSPVLYENLSCKQLAAEAESWARTVAIVNRLLEDRS